MAKTAKDVADEIDVMAGIGHASMLTDEGQARRRAADLIRWQADRLAAIENEHRDMRRLIALLVDRLGGEVEINDAEIVELDPESTIETWRSDTTNGRIIRSRVVHRRQTASR